MKFFERGLVENPRLYAMQKSNLFKPETEQPLQIHKSKLPAKKKIIKKEK